MSLTVIRPLQRAVGIDDGQLLDLVAVEDPLASSSVVPTGAVTRPRRGHQRADRLARVVLEAKIAVGQDPDEGAGGVGDRDAGDAVARHQRERVGDRSVRRQRHRLDDHPRLGALHLVDLGDLVLDREVAVDDPDPAGAGERDRQPRLGDGVHRRRHDGDRELELARQPRARRDVVREHLGLGRDRARRRRRKGPRARTSPRSSRSRSTSMRPSSSPSKKRSVPQCLRRFQTVPMTSVTGPRIVGPTDRFELADLDVRLRARSPRSARSGPRRPPARRRHPRRPRRGARPRAAGPRPARR